MWFRKACLVLAVVAIGGCSGGDAPPPSTDANSQNGQQPPDNPQTQNATEPQTADPGDGKSPNGEPVREASVTAALRDNLAKLARGKGKDDAVKTDLEKLDAEGKSQLFILLQDPAADVRLGAAYFLLDSDLSDPQAAADFSVTLNDAEAEIRHIGLQAIRLMPQNVLLETTPQLVKFVARKDESRANRVTAARLIGTLEADGRSAATDLTKVALEDTDEQVRKACLYSISKIAEPAAAVAVYRQVLGSDAPPGVRRVAAFWLGKLGSAAAAAVDDLAAALEDVNEEVRVDAREALVEIGSSSVSALVGKLASPDAGTRGHAVLGLGKLEAVAKPALPELRKRLQDEDMDVRELAARVIPFIESAR